MAFLVERGICLCYDEVILFVRGQVYNLVGYTRVGRIGFIYNTVRSLNEAVLVDLCVGCKGVDQTDVRSLRSLDRAHTSVMGVVYISNLESGTVTGQTARSQCGETSLVSQLRQRVVLVHELGQLGASEELLHRCGNRLNVD